MKIFISWSLPRSKAVAAALKDWLSLVILVSKPYMSAEDIDKGTLWSGKILDELESTDIGISCVTPENLQRPWLSFEAGAIAKRVGRARVIPFLFGMDKKDVPADHPLFLFQGTTYDQADVVQMIGSIVDASDTPSFDRKTVEHLANLLWPQLKAQLDAVAANPDLRPHSAPPQHSQQEMIEEILELTRSQQRVLREMSTVQERAASHTERSSAYPDAPPWARIPGGLHFSNLDDLESWLRKREVYENIRARGYEQIRRFLHQARADGLGSQHMHITLESDAKGRDLTITTDNLAS